MDKQSFDELVELAMQQPGRANMRPVVEKELLHYEILHALDKANLLRHLTFQGGTSLRLCHGSSRFSEDLDFAGGRNFNAAGMAEIKNCIKKQIGDHYGLKVAVKEPDDMPFNVVKVDTWQVSVETAPLQKSIPRQRIKIEVAGIPAHTRELVPLRLNYDFLQSYGGILVNAETLDEVMADKVLAFPVARNIRYRDIWDLAWLEQQGAKLDTHLVALKIEDYRIEGYEGLLAARISQLGGIIHSKQFHDQMTRFIDAERLASTIDQPAFLAYLDSTLNRLFTKMQEHFSPPEEDEAPTFRM